MIKLVNAVIFGIVLCVVAKADDHTDAYLSDSMDRITRLMRESVPLVGQELSILDEKYRDQQYKNLRDTMHSPLSKPTDIFGNPMPSPGFPDAVKARDFGIVTQSVLGTVSQARGLDGIMLAEAEAGSPQRDRLLDLYQKQELEAAKLLIFYQMWAFGPR